MTSRPDHTGHLEVAPAIDEIAELVALAYCRLTYGRIPEDCSCCPDHTNLAISDGQSVHGVVE
jgi:hypothetical protein